MKNRFAAIVPAAGLSSRMGDFKPLMPFGSGTVIEASVDSALSAAERAVIVLGRRGDEIRELLAARFGDRLVFAANPDYAATDMLCSVRIALRTLDVCDAFFISPADMPVISPAVYQTLARSFDTDDAILIPTAAGRRGHPPLISARLIPEICAYEGEGGLRGFYRLHKVREVAVEDNGILQDLDLPEDYRALMNR